MLRLFSTAVPQIFRKDYCLGHVTLMFSLGAKKVQFPAILWIFEADRSRKFRFQKRKMATKRAHIRPILALNPSIGSIFRGEAENRGPDAQKQPQT